MGLLLAMELALILYSVFFFLHTRDRSSLTVKMTQTKNCCYRLIVSYTLGMGLYLQRTV